MRDDTNRGAVEASAAGQEALAEVGLPLEELVRRGARDILQRAIEAEVETLLDEFSEVSLIDGRRAVVRNGHLPAREILTTVGPVEVRVPKVRDRTSSGVKFNSALAPPYVRRSARVAAALPWLYLKGVSSGDLGEALEVLVGEGAKGLSPAALGRLKAQWSEEYQGSLEGKEYAYFWVDGIYTSLRESEEPKLCLLVIIGVTADGTKEWVAIEDGLRECTASWLDVLRDLKERGLKGGPRLAVGDGALGFWSALEQVYPETVHQRCWFHKLGNVLAALPKSLQGKAKSDLQASLPGAHPQGRRAGFRALPQALRGQVPKGDREAGEGPRRPARLLRLPGRALGAPAHHQPDRVHVRDRAPPHHAVPKNCVSRSTFLGLAFKLAEEAAKSWRRIRAPEKVAELLAGTRYEDGIPVTDDPPEKQREAA